MSFMNLIPRIPFKGILNSTRSLYVTPVSFIHSSPILFAEPLKKKKRLDPQIVKQREERRKRKLEKQIRRLEKNARQLKPIEELEIPIELIDEKKQRLRSVSVSQEDVEQRFTLQKQWAKYKHEQRVADFLTIDKIVQSQMKALEELRKESEELYQEAIQIDLELVPTSLKGPLATPPIENYPSPDGEYTNIVKKWE